MTAFETTVLVTPVGPLAIVVDPTDGAVVVSGFNDLDDQQGRLSAADRRRGFRQVRRSAALDPVRAAVEAYDSNDVDALDTIVVRQAGGPFQQAAWAAMRDVPAGKTITYTELAVSAGNSRAVRAAGTACARNMVAPFVPCHRILRSDGTLGGYYYGLDVKTALLRHEGALL